MNQYLCIHGHFYQPPRENPWTGVIEAQKTAEPFHDWNECITAECYGPNADTQILNNFSHPIETVSNYAGMSFNFGPTLLLWMEKAAPDVYRAILASDKKSMRRFSGHGAAIAQAYNHMIMPLANSRDKRTQVIWGIKDFQYRFKRKPEGMWLPETAVDIETLEVLAEQGITFTILAPKQAQAVKQIGDHEWVDVSEGTIDTQLPYVCPLPSGRSIVIFFYNGQISNEVAFGGLLDNGVTFAERLVGQYPENQKSPRLVHIANDGETYGHHHAYGNMALAYMAYYVELNHLAKITIYGEFLANNSPRFEVKIHEDTSWSCFHGVERWRAHCGCHLNGEKNWNQEWRKYLRETLDWLRDHLIGRYEQGMSAYYADPWQVRNDYIAVVLDGAPGNRFNVLFKPSQKDLSGDDQAKIIDLLETQRYAMLMYTSCGWFFDDISGIETVQILQYAARAMQLAKKTGSDNLEKEFLDRLSLAESNLPKMKNGKRIYNLLVKTSMNVPC